MKKIVKLALLIALIWQNFSIFADSAVPDDLSLNQDTPINQEQCLTIEDKNILIGGWYLWQPYQFNSMTPVGYILTGMDVELVKIIAAKVGVEIKYEEVSWAKHQSDLKEGKREVAAGATYTDERAKFAYFSLPYRFEENSLFVLKDLEKNLDFRNIAEYLAQLRLQNFRIGVIKGFIYGHPQINEFINDPVNNDIVFKYENDTESLQALLRGEVEGFMADRIVGAAAVLNKLAAGKVQEIKLDVKTPIHLMFSKQSVSLELVDRFNQEIKKIVASPEYKKVVKAYLYPVLLMETIDSEWFYIVGIIGTIAFAISGIAIAAKENTTLLGTFLFAMLPSVSGGIMRDVIINRDPVGIFLTPSYMYYILIVVLLGFAIIRFLDYYNSGSNEDSLLRRFWDNLLIICDALGQAAFIVIGVSTAIIAKIEPILLWGPFFAFLTSYGGGILRDLMRKDKVVTCISEGLNVEISIIWGFIFSLFLDMNSYDPEPDIIRYVVIIVAAGAFLTSLLAYYFKIPNLRFRE